MDMTASIGGVWKPHVFFPTCHRGRDGLRGPLHLHLHLHLRHFEILDRQPGDHFCEIGPLLLESIVTSPSMCAILSGGHYQRYAAECIYIFALIVTI